MLTPSIREDLQLFDGTPLEDGSPSWLLFDTLTNKYFTIGLNAFRLLNYWKADVDTKTFFTTIGLQFLFNSFLRFSVVIQKEALVFFAISLYLLE